jgi:hypothetical protein
MSGNVRWCRPAPAADDHDPICGKTGLPRARNRARNDMDFSPRGPKSWKTWKPKTLRFHATRRDFAESRLSSPGSRLRGRRASGVEWAVHMNDIPRPQPQRASVGRPRRGEHACRLTRQCFQEHSGPPMVKKTDPGPLPRPRGPRVGRLGFVQAASLRAGPGSERCRRGRASWAAKAVVNQPPPLKADSRW